MCFWRTTILCIALIAGVVSVCSAQPVGGDIPTRAKGLLLQPSSLVKRPSTFGPWKTIVPPNAMRVQTGPDADILLEPGITTVYRTNPKTKKRRVVITSACAAVVYETNLIKRKDDREKQSSDDWAKTLVGNVTQAGYSCTVRVCSDPSRAKQAFELADKKLRAVLRSLRGVVIEKYKCPDGVDTVMHYDYKDPKSPSRRRVVLVQAGDTVGMLAMRLFQPEGIKQTYGSRLIGNKATDMANKWVASLAVDSGPVIIIDTKHKPIMAKGRSYDKWIFSQGDYVKLTGQVLNNGRPIPKAKVTFKLISPTEGSYDSTKDSSLRERVVEAGTNYRIDQKPVLSADKQGKFKWNPFFAPHASTGDWKLTVLAEFTDPKTKKPVRTEAAQLIKVIEDPRLTAEQLKKNYRWLQRQWRLSLPVAGPIQKLSFLQMQRLRAAQIVARCWAIYNIGHKARTWGPLNNLTAVRSGGIYLQFTCGGIATHTLQLLNDIRYSPDEVTRKRMCGIAYMPITNWPSANKDSSWALKARDSLYNHVAIMLYYSGYKRLGLSRRIYPKKFTDPAYPWAKQQGFTTPHNAVVLEYWLNQQREVMPIKKWIDTFTSGHIGIAPAGWRSLCPIPDWEKLNPKPSGPGDYTVAKLHHAGKAFSAGGLRHAARKMEILTLSPVTILATDAKGRKTGATIKGGPVCEIPGSNVECWPEVDGSFSLHLLLPPGEVDLSVTGCGQGPFGLLMILPERDKLVYFPKTQTLQPGQIAHFKLPAKATSADLVLPDGTRIKPETVDLNIPAPKINPAEYAFKTWEQIKPRPVSKSAGMDLDKVDPNRPAVEAKPKKPAAEEKKTVSPTRIAFGDGKWANLTNVFRQGTSVKCFSDNAFRNTAVLTFWVVSPVPQKWSIGKDTPSNPKIDRRVNHGHLAKASFSRYSPGQALIKAMQNDGIPADIPKAITQGYVYRVKVQAPDNGNYACYRLYFTSPKTTVLGHAKVDRPAKSRAYVETVLP